VECDAGFENFSRRKSAACTGESKGRVKNQKAARRRRFDVLALQLTRRFS
jgi:hypothetical protein